MQTQSRVRSLLGLVAASLVLAGSTAGQTTSALADETLTVPVKNPGSAVVSKTRLIGTQKYELTISGEGSIWDAANSHQLDGFYAYARGGPVPYPVLTVNGQGIDKFVEKFAGVSKVAYRSDHRYRLKIGGVSGQLRFQSADTVANSYNNSGAWTIQITNLGGGGGGGGSGGGGDVERFDFRIAYRLKPATTTPPNCVPTPGTVSGHGNAIVLGGTVNGNGLVENEAPFTAGCRTANISMRVLSAELSVQKIGPQRSIRTVHAVVKISGRSGHNGADCYVDTQGTLTVVDSDVLLRPQGLYADSFSLGGWNKPCGGHRHSWSNANPGSVGPGTIDGSFLSVQILCQGRPGGLSARNCDTT